MVLHIGDRSDLGGYSLPPHGTRDCVPLWSWPSSLVQQLSCWWGQTCRMTHLAKETAASPMDRSVWAQPAPRSAPWAVWVMLTFASGGSFPVVWDFCQLPTSSMCIYSLQGMYPATWMGNMLTVLQPRCLRRLRFFFCWKSSSLFSTSQHPGRVVWVGDFFFFSFIFTIYLSFLVFDAWHHSPSEKLGKFDSRF